MEMKSPVESEFYPCRMSHAHMDDEKPSFEEDHEIYAEEMQTRIAKCKSECVKTVTRVNTSDFPTRVQQPVSKSHTHFKGKHSQSQRRKMRLEADYNLTRPRVRSTRAHPHIYHAYATHPGQMPQTGGVQAPRAQRHSPPVSPPFVIGIPTEIRPSELRQARPRLIGMPNMMTAPPQHPPPPPMCNMGPPKANIQGPRVGPPPPQPQGPRQMINDQAVYGYQPRQYFMNKYKVLPPVYANLAQEQCYMGGSVPPYQQHAIYQAHYQSHNDIHQQTNNNYARFNAIQQQQQPNQPQIYANWSPNWTGSAQLAGPSPPPPAAAAAQQQQQPQPYNNQPSQPQRPQQQQPPQQQYQQPYMNHSNLVLEQSGTDQMNDPAAANNPAHKKKSIITSIFTFPRFVFKGFK